MVLDIAHSFQQDSRGPVLDLLPALERIEVLSVAGWDNLYVSICDAFELLIAARQRAGRCHGHFGGIMLHSGNQTAQPTCIGRLWPEMKTIYLVILEHR